MKSFQETFHDRIDATNGTVVLDESTFKRIQFEALRPLRYSTALRIDYKFKSVVLHFLMMILCVLTSRTGSRELIEEASVLSEECDNLAKQWEDIRNNS